MPLADHVGYELAVALTLVAALFAPAVGFSAVRIEATTSNAERRPARAVAAAGGFAVAALLVPTAIILLNALRRPICDPVAGSVWLLLLSAPTAWLSATLGALASLLFTRRWIAIAAVVAVELGSAMWTFLVAYVGPAYFGLDHFAGYYTAFARGAIPVTAALVTFRLSTIAWGVVIVTLVGAVWSTSLSVRRMHRSWTIALATGLVVVSVGWGDTLGWRTTDRTLRRALAAEQRVDNMVLHYPRDTPDRAIDAMVRDVAYTGAQVQQALGLTSAHPVHVWAYATGAQKSRLVGGGFTNFAKPYRHEVHITGTGFPLASLRHEMIHAFAGEFAPLPWRAAGGLIPNVALIEGLAEAYDIDDDALTLFQNAKAMRELGIAPDIAKLMSPAGFEAEGTSRAYMYSGAFMRYVGTRYGTAAVRQLYATDDFSALGGAPTVIAGFERMLDTVQSNANARSSAARRLATPGITRRTCAREIYALTDSAFTLAANRLWNESLRMYDRACALQPENPELLAGKLAIAIRMRAPTIAPVQAIANALFSHPRTDPTLAADAHVRLGDAHWRLGDVAAARREYTIADSIPSGPETRRSIVSRLMATRDSAEAQLLRPLFLAEGDAFPQILRMAEAIQQRPNDALLLYLLGRQYYSRGAYQAAAGLLERSDRLGLADPDLMRENARVLATAYASRNECDRAERSLDRLKSLGGSSADLAASADWVRRCRFAVTRGWKPL